MVSYMHNDVRRFGRWMSVKGTSNFCTHTRVSRIGLHSSLYYPYDFDGVKTRGAEKNVIFLEVFVSTQEPQRLVSIFLVNGGRAMDTARRYSSGVDRGPARSLAYHPISCQPVEAASMCQRYRWNLSLSLRWRRSLVKPCVSRLAEIV